MSLPEALKFLHVLSVVIWVGGGVMLQILLARARKAGPETAAAFNQQAEWTSNHVFMPASFAALGSGVWLVIAGNWDFADLWITLGFAGFALSAINGMAVLGPTAKKMKALVAEQGPHDAGAQALARRLDVFGRIDLVILIAVILDMIVKPGQ